MRRAALALALAASACPRPYGEECEPHGDIPPPVSVRITDENGGPVAGARVQLYGSDPRLCSPERTGLRGVGNGETDANGEVTIALGRGVRAVVASASRDDRPAQETTIVADEANLVLGAPRAVRGQILVSGCDPRGIAVDVVLSSPYTGGKHQRFRTIARAVADPDGDFVVEGLGPGHYHAIARGCGQTLETDFTGRDETITLR